MFGRLRIAGALAALSSFLPTFVSAQNTTIPEASTLYIQRTQTQFSLNVANDSADLYIYFASPAYSWVGVGFGTQMENSLMFIMYQNEDGDNVTLSPRLGSKKSEPTFAPEFNIDILPGTQVNDNEFILKAVCRNCRVWRGGFLNVQSQAQPMFYAFGDGNDVQSNSKSANLKRHVRYGHFTMDMTAAIGAGGVPAATSASKNITAGEMIKDSDPTRIAHAIIGCVALFVIWPLNILIAGFFKNIRIHVVLSVVIVVFLIVAYSLGISTSTQYNRSKHFNSAHQILAFISLVPILLLSILPIPSVASLHAKIRSLHTPLVSATFVLLVIGAGLGLHLASQTRPIILAYSAVSLGVFVFNISITACVRRRGSAYRRQNRVREEDEVPMRKLSDQSFQQPFYGYSASAQATTAEGPNRFGGGTMPGPQYMLNMHPGVPVQVNRM